jgi:hypothetical protein
MIKKSHMPNANQLTQRHLGVGGRPVGKCSGIRKTGKKTAIHDQELIHIASHRPGVMTVRGIAKSVSSGTAVIKAGSIKSQPTRLRGWWAIISAAGTEKRTGAAQFQPIILTNSWKVGRPFWFDSQIIIFTEAVTMQKAANSQANNMLPFILFMPGHSF